MLTEFAPAKVNLTLHVTGQRADGYHLLDSLVVFASVGDDVSIYAGETSGLSVTGPQTQGVPTDASNSILKTAARYIPDGHTAGFTLTKHLPSAAGIGGGTADAAAALRLIHRAWPDCEAAAVISDVALATELGADVPVCVQSKSARMRGIGERVDVVEGLPVLHAVLVNPRVEVSTPAVFKTMPNKTNPPMEALPNGGTFLEWLTGQRNDMQAAAIELAPVIGDVLATLNGSKNCELARMSGSGATCFGLYPNAQDAAAAGAAIAASHPNWWVAPCVLNEPRNDVV